jgi:hypothetical protein
MLSSRILRAKAQAFKCRKGTAADGSVLILLNLAGVTQDLAHIVLQGRADEASAAQHLPLVPTTTRTYAARNLAGPDESSEKT